MKIQDATLPPKQSSPAGSMRTAKATAVRQAKYDMHVTSIVPLLAKARTFDIVTAVNLANWLDGHGVSAPDGGVWSKSTMLRALRRLRQLGLEPEKTTVIHNVLDLTKKTHLAIFNNAMKGGQG